MDRYHPTYPWRGEAPRRGRRPPPRRPRRARALPWDTPRGQAWFVAAGVLALLSVFAPRLALGQGLRSQPASITLTVIAPPREGRVARPVIRGESVVDVEALLPAGAAGGEVSVVVVEADSAFRLFVRDVDGRLAPVGPEWVRLASTPRVTYRAIGTAGVPLAGGRWRVRYRVAGDGSRETEATVEVPAVPATTRR